MISNVNPTIYLPKCNFQYDYPHSNAFLQFPLKLKHCMTHKVARHPRICDVVNHVKLFRTVNRRTYCRTFLTLSNQKQRYKSKCIRIIFLALIASWEFVGFFVPLLVWQSSYRGREIRWYYVNCIRTFM